MQLSWDSQEVSSDVLQSDSFGNKNFKEVQEGDDDRKHMMETDTGMSEWDAIFESVMETMKLYYVMSVIDLILQLIIYVVLRICHSKAQAFKGLANPLVNFKIIFRIL